MCIVNYRNYNKKNIKKKSVFKKIFIKFAFKSMSSLRWNSFTRAVPTLHLYYRHVWLVNSLHLLVRNWVSVKDNKRNIKTVYIKKTKQTTTSKKAIPAFRQIFGYTLP